MTRLALFQALCALHDDLHRVTRVVKPDLARHALEAITGRVDALIDGCVRGGMPVLHEEDTSPCPHCGQERCTLAEERLTLDLDPDVQREDEV